MRYLLAILLTLGVSYGQSIYVTDQNIFDLVPDRDALTGLAGSQRIKATFNDGIDPLDVTAGLPISLVVKSRVDDYQVTVASSITSVPPDTVWWVLPALSAGQYELTADITLPDDSFRVFWRNLTVTSAPSASLSLTNINNITIDQSTSITNFIDQFIGINVLEPVVVSTNVSGTWTINLTTNNPVGIYVQTASITSVVFAVDSTNDVALGEVMLLATTNAITWPTNGLTWASVVAPTPTAGKYNRIYFEAWRDAVFGVYVGSNP